MNDDAALLRAFAHDGSQAAFAELVRRHVGLVYAAAMRRTGGDTHVSVEVTQQVFGWLARQAKELTTEPALGPWLHAATRPAAVKAMLAEERRRARDFTAGETGAAEDADWGRLRPLIDDVIDELPAADRAALVARFFERRQFAELGAVLGVPEETARGQTDHALEALREALGRRGVASTGAALAAVVSGQPVVSAPAGLATAIVAQSFAGGGPVAAGGKGMSFASALLLVACAAVVFAAGTYLGQHWHAVPDNAGEVARLDRSVEALRAENAQLETNLQNARDEAAAAKDANAVLADEVQKHAAAREAPRRSLTLGMARDEVQQAVLANLRQIAAARRQFLVDKGHAPASVQELVGANGYIKSVRTVSGEDYADLPMADDAPLTVSTPDGITVTYDPAGVQTTRPDAPPETARAQELAKKVAPTVVKAVAAYRKANDGADPPNDQALLPFFATPQEGADYVDYLEATKSSGGDGP
ncbi:MAG TPA: sigma-70 family RNA polymerase sigma factor [Opitutus sp.]|nr:sigma-70 family RNA polymerase sigma factor [Opitutus sp.]